MKSRSRSVILLGILLLCTACSVQIYDLQPIIIGTNTPTSTIASPEPFVGTTATPAASIPTATPPIHIAPTKITAMTAVNILEIAMIDGGTGWAIGQIPGNRDKIVLRTADGANTWKNVTPSQAIYDYAEASYEISGCFRDGYHAWIVFHDADSYDLQNGIFIWRTEDGGQTWESAALPVNGYPLQFFSEPKIGFIDNQTGWIFARIGQNEAREYIGIYTTHDRGSTWTAMVNSNSGNLPSQGKKNGAVFRDTLEGWVSCENTPDEPDLVLWHTVDGGNSWVKQMLPAPTGMGIPYGPLIDPSYKCSLSVPKFTDVQQQYAWAKLRCIQNGSDGQDSDISILYWTQDKLSTWKTLRLPNAEGDLSFYGVEYGWYAVRTAPGSDFPYEILFTEDGGENWRTASKLAWDSKLQFITPSIGFAIATYNGMPALVKSSNSGFSWEQVFPMVVP